MPENLCTMHREACRKHGAKTALRFRQKGLFQDISWSEYRLQADLAAAALIDLGVQPGDRVAILSENCYEWLVADHAILSTGAADVPLHAPLSPAQVKYQVGHSGAKGIVVSGQAQAEKVAEVLANLPELEFLIAFDPLEITAARLQVISWEELQRRGVRLLREAAGEIERREESLSGDDLATIIYTSGTTGNPKGVMLTHNNLLSNAVATCAISHTGEEDVLLSWLPYSHIYARTVDHYTTTYGGAQLVLSASIDDLIEDLKEIRPTWLTAVPRFYEKVWNSVEQLDPEERRRKLTEIFGPNAKQLNSGGAPLPRHVCEGFHAAGLPLYEGYGLTESSPVIAFNHRESWKIGTVGRAIPGVEVRIADDGEILTRGPHVMKGYWKNPEATAEAIVDGWLRTGDVGELDKEGFLTITDRKKDLIVTSGGKNVVPGEIERLLVSDPYIDQAVVYGDGRPFVSALLVPNFENLNEKAAELGCAVTVEDEFITATPLMEFYEERIAELMQAVSSPERVKKFLLLARPFQLDADELTATLKVRRRHIIGKYEAELAALYEG